MYFITESAAIECGCILGGIVSCMVWCSMSCFLCVFGLTHAKILLAIWSLEYFQCSTSLVSFSRLCTKYKHDFHLHVILNIYLCSVFSSVM